MKPCFLFLTAILLTTFTSLSAVGPDKPNILPISDASKATRAEGKFHLAVDGKSNCVIVVNAVHQPAGGGMSGNTWFAATELQKYLKRMSGAELAIVALADNASAELKALQGKPVIAIGESAFTRRLGIPDRKTLTLNVAVMLALQRLNNIVPKGTAVNRQLLDDWIRQHFTSLEKIGTPATAGK